MAKPRKRRTTAKFTIPNPEMSYEAWLKIEAKFRKLMDGKAIDHRTASVIVREGRR